MKAYRRRRFACEEMVELVTDYLEGSLSWRVRRRFEAHLSECDHCTDFIVQMRTTIALAGTLTSDDLSHLQQSEMLALFRRWCLESQ